MQEVLVVGAVLVGVLNLVAGVAVSIWQWRRVSVSGAPPLVASAPTSAAGADPPGGSDAGDPDKRANLMLEMLRRFGNDRDSLPRRRAADGPTATASPPEVLLVEDDVDLNTLLARALATHGYHVRVAANGVEGLSLLHERPERLGAVLLDLGLSDMNGFEFLVEQAADPSVEAIPVIVISGREGIDETRRPKAWVHTLHKPVTVDEVVDAVRRFAR